MRIIVEARNQGESHHVRRPMRRYLERYARRHPIALFLILAFGIGVPLMLSASLGEWDTAANRPAATLAWSAELVASFLLVWGALLPAALIVTALEGGRPAVRALISRATRWRIGVGWWALILVGLPTTTIGLALLLGDTFQPLGISIVASELGSFLIALLVFNFAEEIAWAGFCQTRLERRHNLFLAAALTAIPFAGIHLPLALINGTSTPVALAVRFVVLMVLATIVRLLLGVVLRGAGDSLLAVGAQHTVFNRSNNPDGIVARLVSGEHRQLAGLLATAFLAVVICLAIRSRLTRAERLRLDAVRGEPVTSPQFGEA